MPCGTQAGTRTFACEFPSTRLSVLVSRSAAFFTHRPRDVVCQQAHRSEEANRLSTPTGRLKDQHTDASCTKKGGQNAEITKSPQPRETQAHLLLCNAIFAGFIGMIVIKVIRAVLRHCDVERERQLARRWVRSGVFTALSVSGKADQQLKTLIPSDKAMRDPRKNAGGASIRAIVSEQLTRTCRQVLNTSRRS